MILTGKRSACADASTSPRSVVGGGGGGGVVLNSPIWPIQGCARGQDMVFGPSTLKVVYNLMLSDLEIVLSHPRQGKRLLTGCS